MASAIGLDIGSSAVRAVQLTGGKGGHTLDRLGQVMLPPGAVRDGEIVDPDAVVEALQILMSRYKFKGKKVALGVANQQVVVRQVDLPSLPEAQLRESLPFQVQDYIPIPVDQALLDFEILEEYANPDGTAMSRLLLVAAAREMVDELRAVMKKAKLEPVLLDLDAFALLRALADEPAPVEEGQPRTVTTGELIVNVGSTVTNIVVHSGGIPRFVRILLMGGNSVTESLQNSFGVSWEQAEAMKSAGHAPGSPEGSMISERAQRFIDEVRGSLDYYRAQGDSVQVERVILSGGGAELPNLAERLAEAVRLPVDRGHPMQSLQIGKVDLEPAQLAEAEPFLAVAVGLAMGALE